MRLRNSVLPFLVLLGCRPAVGPAPGPLSPASVTAAQVRWPDATVESLEDGRAVFLANCNRCHGYPDFARIHDDKWPSIIERMGKKAKLDGMQKEFVLRFILAESAPSTPTEGGSQ